jgi:hypothetical protein
MTGPIMTEQDLAAVARTIIDANQYMTLAMGIAGVLRHRGLRRVLLDLRA